MFSYTDPLVGIIILVAIIALVTFIDYYRNRYKDKQKEKSLKNLTKSYEFVGLTQGVEEFLALSDNPIPTLQFIANAYIQSGNTQEEIKILVMLICVLKKFMKICLQAKMSIFFMPSNLTRLICIHFYLLIATICLLQKKLSSLMR